MTPADAIASVVAAVAVIALVGGVARYVFNFLRGWVASLDVKLDTLRKRVHDYNNLTAGAIAEMNYDVGILKNRVETIEANIHDLKEADRETRVLVTTILESMGDINKNLALLAQKYDLD